MRTLVLGASGFVGSALVRALHARGENVRAASRHAPRDRGTRAPQWVFCDLERPETLPAALEGVDCAYYLVHSMATRTGQFRAIERRSATAFAHAASDAGCRRIIYLGGVTPQHGPLSQHLASRIDVGEILRGGDVPTVELRASMIIGNGSASWQIVRDLAVRLPFMLLPQWLESKSAPIALADVLAALLDARNVPLDGSWFDIPGPDILSMREMLEMVAALDHRTIPAVRVPVLSPRLSALWLKLVTRTDYRIARELVLGLGQDLLPRDARFWELTGHPARHSFLEAAALALDNEPRGSAVARAVEHFVHRLGHAI